MIIEEIATPMRSTESARNDTEENFLNDIIMQRPWHRKFQYPALALSVAVWCLYPFVASASPLISINPVHLEFTANPGDHLAASFKFWNGTTADLPIHWKPPISNPKAKKGKFW